MTTAGDRETAIQKEVEAIRDVYRMNGSPEIVTLFAEDYHFLSKRKRIANELLLEGFIQVRRGQRKKKARKRRPKSSLFQDLS